jgi:dipeptidase E
VSNPVPKLILHSDQSLSLTGGRDAELLRSLSGRKAPRILYIPSARSSRQKAFDDVHSYYSKLGFPDVTFFEPEDQPPDGGVRAFQNTDVVHLSGGEVIAFARRLRMTGCDLHLKKFLDRGGVVLGVSAGAMILSRTFKTSVLFGERGEFQGLGVVDFEIIPHASEHFPRRDLIDRFAKEKSVPVYAMDDGDIITVNGRKICTFGSPTFHFQEKG